MRCFSGILSQSDGEDATTTKAFRVIVNQNFLALAISQSKHWALQNFLFIIYDRWDPSRSDLLADSASHICSKGPRTHDLVVVGGGASRDLVCANFRSTQGLYIGHLYFS